MATKKETRKRPARPDSSSRVVRQKVSKICEKYERDGCCPYGETCKKHHPESPFILPDEILIDLVNHLDLTDICNLARVCSRFRVICRMNIRRWHALFVEKWGPPSQLEWRAASLAGGWQELYKAKTFMDRSSLPWKRPSTFEIDALGQLIADSAFECHDPFDVLSTPPSPLWSYPSPPSSVASDSISSVASALTGYSATPPSPLQAAKALTVMFCLDGSGSLSEMDFDVMRNFVKRTVQVIRSRVPNAKVGMIQFTTEVRVEISPTAEDFEAVCLKVDSMARMNGGTNLAAPILRSEQLLQEHMTSGEHTGGNVVVLLSDGIVEPHQARTAAERASQMQIILPNVSIYALGVGRDVDVSSMKQIIGENPPPPPSLPPPTPPPPVRARMASQSTRAPAPPASALLPPGPPPRVPPPSWAASSATT